MIIKIIGLTAAFLTTLAYLPQAIKTWKTKSTHDLSPVMFFMLFIGLILWLIYGIQTRDLPIILSNIVTISLAGIIMYFIFNNTKPRKVDHIGIWTNDLENMKEFYTTAFQSTSGEKYVNPKRNFSSYFINFTTGTQIELMHQPGNVPTEASKNHIAISVGSKSLVDSHIEEFKKQGIKIIGLPRTTGDGYYEAVIADPEGNLVEIVA